MDAALSQRQIKSKENDISEYKNSLAKKLQQAKSNLRVREIKQIRVQDRTKYFNSLTSQIAALMDTYGKVFFFHFFLKEGRDKITKFL